MDKVQESLATASVYLIMMKYLCSCAQIEKTVNEKFADDLEMKCKNCGFCKGGGKSLSEYLDRRLREALHGGSSFDGMEKLLDEHIRLMKEGSIAEIADFLVKVANDAKFSCTQCSGVAWEVLPFSDEKKIVRKKEKREGKKRALLSPVINLFS
ncbi:hypothetical protein K2W90_02750 [Candidatus Babeliales bacterium]|nr:hypothetical protein [Candidatus Babeliales bacterium]